MPEHTAAPAPEIQQRVELVDQDSALAEQIAHEVCLAAAAAEEELAVGMERTDLRPQPCGRERQPIRRDLPARPELPPGREREFVGADDWTRQVQLVSDVEERSTESPGRRFAH